MASLIAPHGDKLIDCYLTGDELIAAKAEAQELPSWDLTQRQLCDIELILNGGFSPLDGFLNKADYEGVCKDMRLADGTLWPMPITLDISDDFAEKVDEGKSIILRDLEGVVIAILDVESKWTADKEVEAEQVFGTKDVTHPSVDFLLNRTNPVYLGGKLRGIETPGYYDYQSLRDSPAELRAKFKVKGWSRVVAFQTRSPMHKAHKHLTFRAARELEANLLIQPVVGMTNSGDIDHYSRVRCYEHVLKEYPEQTTDLSLLPLAMRMGGPREALWHAIIRKNYGCTHFIVGRDHASPGQDSNGNDFYGPNKAQDLLKQFEDEIGIKMIPFEMMVYVQERAEFVPVSQIDEDDTVLSISTQEFLRRLGEGLVIPEWFSYPSVVEELRRTQPPKDKQGFAVFFTGLSGSGKSAIANALMVKFLETGKRSTTLLDGDLVRKHLSSELTFSKEHRDINITRIGYVASEIVKNGGVAICAPIAPYTTTRRRVREMIEAYGGFIEVHVATSLEECERRDRKGIYALARKGVIKEFTGISDPYEEPARAELIIDTTQYTIEEEVQMVLLKLENLGYLK